jgi:hypothetical protein
LTKSIRTTLCLLLSAHAALAQAAHAAQAQYPSQQVAAHGSSAQDLAARVPAAKPEDVRSINAILAAIYDVISGPAGQRDWNRFRALFVPEARFTSTVKRSDSNAGSVRLYSVEDFVQQGGAYFSDHAFYESAIVNRVQRFHNIVQVFSSYESRNAPGEKPFSRGVNSIQLFYDGSRWWVLSILWDEESPGNPLPPDMATRSAAPVTQ